MPYIYFKTKNLFLLIILLPYFSFSQEIDSSFGVNGYLPYGGALSNLEFNKGIGFNSVVQPDGKIVLAIDKADLNGPTDLDFYTYRYKSDGTPDISFGTNGVSRIFAGENSRGYDITLQPDGKVLVTGETEYCVNGICGASQLILFRLKPNGDLDSTFGNEGKIISSDIFGTTGSFAIPYRVHLLSNGKIILGGKAGGGKPFITRLNQNGFPDLSFAQNGVHIEDIPYSQVVDLQVDDAGNSYELINIYRYINSQIDTVNPTEIRIVKLNTQGLPESSFGSNGRLTLNFSPEDTPASILTLPNQSLVLIGDNWFTRITPTGMVSSDFPLGFKALTTPFNEPITFKKVISISDTRFMLCGSLNPMVNGNYRRKGLITVLNENGEFDSDFNQTGFMVFDYGMLSSSSWDWQGKYAVFHDIDVLENGTLYATGMRNAIAGNTMPSVFLLKMTGIDFGTSLLDLAENEPIDFHQLTVYPNPATNEIQVKITPQETFNSFSIFSIDGEIVQQNPVINTSKIQTIEIQDLKAGVYFLHGQTNSGNYFTRFIKH